MTRDEAMRLVGECSHGYFANNGFPSDEDRDDAILFIRRLEALGLIDIDKPTDAEKKARGILATITAKCRSEPVGSTAVSFADDMIIQLERAGLKIVDRNAV